MLMHNWNIEYFLSVHLFYGQKVVQAYAKQ